MGDIAIQCFKKPNQKSFFLTKKIWNPKMECKEKKLVITIEASQGEKLLSTLNTPDKNRENKKQPKNGQKKFILEKNRNDTVAILESHFDKAIEQYKKIPPTAPRDYMQPY